MNAKLQKQLKLINKQKYLSDSIVSSSQDGKLKSLCERLNSFLIKCPTAIYTINCDSEGYYSSIDISGYIDKTSEEIEQNKKQIIENFNYKREEYKKLKKDREVREKEEYLRLKKKFHIC